MRITEAACFCRCVPTFVSLSTKVISELSFFNVWAVETCEQTKTGECFQTCQGTGHSNTVAVYTMEGEERRGGKRRRGKTRGEEQQANTHLIILLPFACRFKFQVAHNDNNNAYFLFLLIEPVHDQW